MTRLRRVEARDLMDSRESYMSGLSAPLDGMWESFIGSASHWAIEDAGERLGYFCVNEDGRLLQFHVRAPDQPRAAELFARAIAESGAAGALVSTFEPWLGLCLDHQRSVRAHSFLYHDLHRTEIPLRGFDDVTFELVSEGERKTVEELVRRCFPDDPGDWLTGYLKRLVARGELFALRSAAALLGTGELRVSDTQRPHADVGVIVSPEQRGRGLATHILWRLKERAYRAGLVPICSTTADNESAQRAIAKAGFALRHRLLEALF